jgi:hypothetical protein
MKIYVAHSSGFDYQNQLYQPLRQSELNNEHELTLPHETSGVPSCSREFIATQDLVVAEVSYPSTGLGIELGWADSTKVPIVCFYQHGHTFSDSIRTVANDFIEYEDAPDLAAKLGAYIAKRPQ